MTKEIVNIDGVEYVLADKAYIINLSNIVLVRTYSAGVHFGELISREEKCIVLKNSRRIWSWKGACSLSQIAIDGVDVENSNISVVVPEITLTEAIEIIPMSIKAAKQLMEAPEWKK